jgi:hypothetical protein
VRSRAEVSFALELVRAGWNDCEIARETGIPRRTILDWRSGRIPDFDRVRTRPSPYARSCNVCGGDPLRLPQGAYTYLVRGHGKVPAGGQVEVPAGGQVEVPAPRCGVGWECEP